MRVCVSVESKLERARSLESSRRTPTKREREREVYVLGGDVLKRDEKDFRGDILMRKTRFARKNEREREAEGRILLRQKKSRTTNALNASSFFAR